MKNRPLTLIILALFLIQVAILVLVNVNPFGPPKPVQFTPIPTLAAATLPPLPIQSQQFNIGKGECRIAALDLVTAWVAAGTPENDPFEFKSEDDLDCLASFEQDVFPLFNQPNIWYAGAIACTTCHGQDIAKSAANLSLNSYQDILAGSRRVSSQQKGQDILKSKEGWERSILYIQIFTRQMPIGRPFDSPQKGPILRVGTIQR
ncbi:MAG: hypothetical protein HPY59_12040 [Anaerolineae bacterium]|nr:hypothetical protein [Anaerolineae bacterium]